MILPLELEQRLSGSLDCSHVWEAIGWMMVESESRSVIVERP